MTFYTYLWLREDGTPYYVGKGSGSRAISKADHKVLPPGKERTLIQEFPSEEDAFESEKFLIAYYGRKDVGTGILRNQTDGGEGASFGHSVSEETRNKIGMSQKNRIHLPPSEETRRKTSLSLIGHTLSEETRKKISDAHKGKKMSKSARRKMSESKMGNKNALGCKH